MNDRDKRPLFMLGIDGSNQPILIFAIPESAFNPVESGHSFDFDLNPVGISAKVLLMKCRDHADGLATLRQVADKMGIPIRNDDDPLDMETK